MRTREAQSRERSVNLSDITEIELLILKKMRELTIGEHRSVSHGAGFDFVGLREWQAGDRSSSIDWAQSTLRNFNPLVVREFEQPSTAGVVVVADSSLSTRCGMDGVPIAAAIARVIATIGMSAVFFQDLFSLITFDAGFRQMAAVRPRVGKNHVLHCLDAYQLGRGLQEVKQTDSLSTTLAGLMRKTSLISIVSDFLFEKPREVLQELSQLNSVHDVFLVIIESAFAFDLPAISAGWIEVFDVETGRTETFSRKRFRQLAARVTAWQDEVAAAARELALDTLLWGSDQGRNDAALIQFVAERRLRKA